MDTKKLERKLNQKEASIDSQKQLINNLESQCTYFRTRCLELELWCVENKLKTMPRKSRDLQKYTGDELIAAKLVIDDLQIQLAHMHAELKSTSEIHRPQPTRLPSPESPPTAAYKANPNGLRWAEIELGPTSMYSQ